MSEHMKKPPIKAQSHGCNLIVNHHSKTYVIPKVIAEQYVIEKKLSKKVVKKAMTMHALFEEVDKQYTKAGALLKGVRYRENLTQVAFAKKIGVTQANLSNMENGRRPIGKIIAKRIGEKFKINYRYFLE